MKEVVMYKEGSFNDYQGKAHVVTVCGVTQRDEAMNNFSEIFVYDGAEDPYGEPSPVNQTLSIGVAIQNPSDKNDSSKGQTISYNRAKSVNDGILLTSSQLGFFNNVTVTTILENYLNYILRDPGSIIKGYDNAEKKYKEAKAMTERVNQLSPEEKSTIKLLASHTVQDLEDAKKLVKYLK